MTWTTLPHDKARCLGRRDFSAETDTCPRRSGCARYLAAVEGQFGRADHPAPWYLWLCEDDEFKHRIDAESTS